MTRSTPLELGRESYARREWADAYQALIAADNTRPLGIDDLNRLAWAAALLGHDDTMLSAHERLYQANVDFHNEREAARSAFWLGFRLFSMGERGRATAWLERAKRLCDKQSGGCAVHGYLLLPQVHQHMASHDFEAAGELAAQAVTLGERFREPDLTGLARNLQGRAYLRSGRISEGLALLDEAMLAVTAGELSPLVTGLIYCNVIAGCQQISALERSREWTEALSTWCETQPQLVKFTGACLAHRAEIMQFSGQWNEALEEAQRATALKEMSGAAREAAANGYYQIAEIHRLRGEFSESELAYQRANDMGRQPQPGLALLRVAQGQTPSAAASIRRVMEATPDPLLRISLLPAHIDIMLESGAIAEAEVACAELEALAKHFATSVLCAAALQSRGSVLLAEGKGLDASVLFTKALASWQSLNAPFMVAQCRMQLARACAFSRDCDSAELELKAARAILEQLSAKPALSALDDIVRSIKPSARKHGLTARELEVLGLVAHGKTNKVIARELQLSEKTVDRHVSNIFAKIGSASRAAATAYAYENQLFATGGAAHGSERSDKKIR